MAQLLKAIGWLIATGIALFGAVVGYQAWKHPVAPPPDPSSSAVSSIGPASTGTTVPATVTTTTPATAPGTTAQGTIDAPGYPGVTVFSGPATTYQEVAQIPNGTVVQITCTVLGAPIRGPYETSDLWDRIAQGYVPDSVVATGTNQPAAPECPS